MQPGGEDMLVPDGASAHIATPALPLEEEFKRITQRMYSQNLALAQTNRTLSILSKINALSLDSGNDLRHLSSEISNFVVRTVPYPVAAIMSLNKFQDEVVTLQGASYSDLLSPSDIAAIEPILRNLYLGIGGGWLGSDRHSLILDISQEATMSGLKAEGFSDEFIQVLRYFRQECGVSSVYFTKLSARKILNGVLVVGLEGKLPTIGDLEFIEHVSNPTGVALDNRMLYEENQRFLQELQTTNSHLRELDAAKDEFIGLASHQLRTPLTSIKGFLSLVLDGETGPISNQQRTMLQHAFDSSQRMVYLIADLLNASRLRSGKFIIMNHETYLPDLVETEINQLSSTAADRNVSLTFDKPDSFPKLMLDETKIRQVIMNFLDNALFYTPAGGSVRVQLTANENEVTYTVTDTGLGVPQADRAQLFNQFFRAENARKVRPEGTGLGLYMAKKVVDAQGGSIIFASEEGKGSTFGFRFQLNKNGVSQAGAVQELSEDNSAAIH